MTDELVGQVFDGRYRVIAPLASGGMATVYRAVQLNVDREVAIKVMRPDDNSEHDLVGRFRSEAKIISDLRHPNTLKLIDYGTTDDGLLYIVTELLSGRPLSSVVKDEAPLEPRRVLRLIRDVCLSLAEAHDRGIVHRDLKPANIFIEHVGTQDVVKVLDFGVAKVTPSEAVAAQTGSGATPQTMAGVILGTPSYLSPEQAFGRAVDGRADLYSLGVVAFQCLTGALPFQGEAIAQIAAHGLEAPPRPSRSGVCPKLPAKVEALVVRLLSKEPDQRAASALALAQEAERLLLDPDLEREPRSPLLWVVPTAVFLAAITAFVIVDRRTVTDVPVPVMPDAGVGTVDAIATDDRLAPSTATISSAVIERDGGVRTGLRVLEIEVTKGFKDHDVSETIDRIEPTLVDCHEGTQHGEHTGRTLALTIVSSPGGNSLSVEPNDEEGDRFRRCAAFRLPSKVIPGAGGQLRLIVGE